MLPGLVSNLTAIALLGHILLGCCWHHAHDERIARTGPGDADPPGHHGDRHAPGHTSACSHQPEDGRRQGSDDCHGARCVFFSDGSPRTSAAEEDRFREGGTAAAAVLAGLSAASSFSPVVSIAPPPRPPLSIHLLHQVLLL